MNFKLDEGKLFTLLLVIIILSGLSLFFQVVNLQIQGSNSPALVKNGSQFEVQERPSFEPSLPARQRYVITDVGSLTEPSFVESVSVNSSGWVVGNANGGDGYPRPILSRDGHIQALGFPSPGILRGWARDINDGGSAVGSVEDGVIEKPVWWNSSFLPQMLPTGTAARGQADGINNLGEIVGNIVQIGPKAVKWSGGQMTLLESLGGSKSYAHDINDGGKIVGSSTLTNNETYFFACLWDKGQVVELGALPDGLGSSAEAINENGEAVGFSFTPHHNFPGGGQVKRAVAWRDGEIVDLGSLPGNVDFSYALGINDRGWIVGSSGGGFGQESVATLWRDGVIIDLNTYLPENSGWYLLEAHDINERGEITGIGYLEGFSNQSRGFVMKPV